MAAEARTVMTRRLAAAGCVAPDREAAALGAAAPDAETLERWLTRRAHGEPLAWITGRTEFCGRRLHAVPGVYVPRVQSEALARRAARLLPEHGRALDLCTGIGAVAAHLSAVVPTATVVGTDLDPAATGCARRNGVTAVVGDLAAPIRRGRGWDLVTAVAPYVPSDAIRFLPADVRDHEPIVALDGGADGLDLVRRVITAAARLLRPGGWLVVELGGAQDTQLAPTLTDVAFGSATRWHDADGDLRGLAARFEPN
jgi:release factor glutamine methyltransferase